MPNVKKEISKLKHPNSRKTLALTKQINKAAARKKGKLGQFMKQNIIAEKILWFRDNLLPDITVYTADQVEQLIEKYLRRFDEELEQILIKHSIGGRRNRQHASREDIINLTKKREREEFNTSGIEMPDLFNNKNLTTLRQWAGELRFVSHIKQRRVSKKFLMNQSKHFAPVEVEINNTNVEKNGEQRMETATE